MKVDRAKVERVLADQPSSALFILVEDHGTFVAPRGTATTDDVVNLLCSWRRRFWYCGYDAVVWNLSIGPAIQDLGIEVPLCIKITRRPGVQTKM